MLRAKMFGAALVLLVTVCAYAMDMPAGVQTRKTDSGETVLAEAKGMTLYTYDKDALGKSN